MLVLILASANRQFMSFKTSAKPAVMFEFCYAIFRPRSKIRHVTRGEQVQFIHESLNGVCS